MGQNGRESIEGDVQLKFNPTYQIGIRDEFGMLLNHLGLLGNAVEIGVYQGEFSSIMLSFWGGDRYFMVDRWKHVEGYADYANTYDHDAVYKSVCEKFGDNPRATIIKLDSLSASCLFKDGFFDFIHIDADHSYQGCKQDIHAWYPKLRIGGVFSGHDYLDGHNECGLFGVKSAVDEFAQEVNADLRITKEIMWKSWYWIKKS